MISATDNSVGVKDPVSEEQFQEELAPLVKRWQARHEQDLELRYDTGKLLNDHLGTPEQRQARGKGAVQKIAEQLQVAVSEISRTRTFADCFESFVDFKHKHPNAKNWTAVKKLLSTLKQAQASAKKQPSTDGTQQTPKPRKQPAPKVEALVKSFSELSARLRKVPGNLAEEKQKALREAIHDFVKAVPDCLKIQLTVNEVPTNQEQDSASAGPLPPAAQFVDATSRAAA